MYERAEEKPIMTANFFRISRCSVMISAAIDHVVIKGVVCAAGFAVRRSRTGESKASRCAREREEDTHFRRHENVAAKGVARTRLERSFEDAGGCSASWIARFRATITSPSGQTIFSLRQSGLSRESRIAKYICRQTLLPPFFDT